MKLYQLERNFGCYIGILMKSTTYAIIDGAVEGDVLNMLDELSPPFYCLYNEPAQSELKKLAPYLVIATDEVKAWLKERQESWGYYVVADVELLTLRNHLRRFIYALIPNEKRPVFFRFYDPRNLCLLCEVLSDMQLHQFLGPIKTIIIVGEGRKEFQYNFDSRRTGLSFGSRNNQKFLTLDIEQLTALNEAFERRYIKKIALKMNNSKDMNPSCDYFSFAHSVFYYLKRLNITDDRVINGLVDLFMLKKYCRFSDIPESIKDQLESFNAPSLVNAELLLIKELGSVPLLI